MREWMNIINETFGEQPQHGPLVMDADGANEDEIVSKLSACDGKLRIEYDHKKNYFKVTAPQDPKGITVIIPYGIQMGDYHLGDVHDVGEYLYQRYLTPEGW